MIFLPERIMLLSMKKSHKRRIGAHMSVAGGFTKAIDRAIGIGANALQIFSSAPQRWDPPKITKEEGEAFKQKAQAMDVLPVFVHGTYLINLASNNIDIIQKSKESLIADLQFCHGIGATGVIFHFGSVEGGWQAKREYLTFVVREILTKTPEDTYFIIENAAGNGFKIGSSLEELRMMQQDISHPRVKFCLDTAHAFAAGYDFRTSQTAKDFSQQIEKTIGWNAIAAIHCNDSKVECGKKRDLHQNIGEGFIGVEGFFSLISLMPHEIPLLLETPGEHDEGPNKENVERIRNILTAVI